MKPYKRYKRKRRWKRSFLRKRIFYDLVLVFILLCSFSYLLFFSPLFKIKNLAVSENNSSQVPQWVGGNLSNFLIDKLGLNLLLIKTKDLESNILRDYPQIKKVFIKRKLPSTLYVTTEKRIPIGVYCFKENKCFLIDNEGVIFEKLKEPSFSPGIIILSKEKESKNLGERVISEKKLKQILKINKAFQELKIKVRSFSLFSGERLNLKTSQGWEVYFDLTNDLDQAFLKLGLLLEKEIPFEKREDLEYIDLRFSKSYYKFK